MTRVVVAVAMAEEASSSRACLFACLPAAVRPGSRRVVPGFAAGRETERRWWREDAVFCVPRLLSVSVSDVRRVAARRRRRRRGPVRCVALRSLCDETPAPSL
ncbi:hypothetical protein KC19_VG018700 [Ceratodon purpureus]|uniref:Uncharacterized protein n=1 Tax=Ceratodon purpureus TaxID=3225 RepID=A0A8T0HL66_CERPU|nr:hypothetical protein KC19_VG018700 [Ceratodon purpureus]